MTLTIKSVLPLVFFIVTWNEYGLKTTEPCQKLCDGSDCWNWPIGCVDGDIFSVEISTFSRKFATQKDVDLFVPRHKIESGYERRIDDGLNGIISPNAFNIKIEEIK